MVGVIGFFYYDQVSHELRFNLNDTFITQYKIDDVKTDSIDYLQKNVRFKFCKQFNFSILKKYISTMIVCVTIMNLFLV